MSSLPSKRLPSGWTVGFCPAAAILLAASLVEARSEAAARSRPEQDDAFFLRFTAPVVFSLVPPSSFAHLETGQTIVDILDKSEPETLGYADGRGEASFSVPVSNDRVFRVNFDVGAFTLAFYPADSPSFMFKLAAFTMAAPQVRVWSSANSVTAIVADPSRRLLLRFTVPTSTSNPERDVSVIAYLEPDRNRVPSKAALDDSKAQDLYRILVNLPPLSASIEKDDKQIALEAAMHVFATVLHTQVADETQYLEARAAGLDPSEWILKDFLRGYIVALHAMLETLNLAASQMSKAERDILMNRARLLASALLMRPYMALSDEGSLAVIDRIISSPSPARLADLRSLIDRHDLRTEFTTLWNQLSRHLAISPQK